MAETPRTPSRDEREFWDRQFDDDDRAGRRDPSRDPSPAPRRSGPRAPQPARLPDGVLTRVVDRVRDWPGDARLGVVVLVLVAVVAGCVWYRIGVGGTSASATTAASRAVTTTSDSATATTQVFRDASSDAGAGTTGGSTRSRASQASTAGSATIAVHVAGAVTKPGVVELPPGSRVIDAVEAVGGAVAGGDLDRLNLAAKVVDGQRVYVARVGQADPGVAGDTGGALGSDGTAAGSGTAPAAKLNLNTATQAQIEELPGIGPTYAQAIIAERQRRGGFKSVNELRSVRGIGDKRFTELAPLVTV